MLRRCRGTNRTSTSSRRALTWEIVFPVIALMVLAYVIYRNVYPAPAFPFKIFPYSELRKD